MCWVFLYCPNNVWDTCNCSTMSYLYLVSCIWNKLGYNDMWAVVWPCLSHRAAAAALMEGTLVLWDKETIDNKRITVWWTNGDVFVIVVLILDPHMHHLHERTCANTTCDSVFFHTPCCFPLSHHCLGPSLMASRKQRMKNSTHLQP